MSNFFVELAKAVVTGLITDEFKDFVAEMGGKEALDVLV